MRIDGSFGEGGGQILRTTLSVSLVTGVPVRVERIRAGRRRPGLRPQHLAAVRAAAEVGRAAIEGDQPGSQTLSFRPNGMRPGRYRFAVGTAGSTGLVLQTVLPALLLAEGPSELVLEGGTHNPGAPPFDYLADTYLPLLARMGPRLETRLERHGFFPAGGGRIRVRIEPAERLSPLHLEERGPVHRTRARALLARLPDHIARRELEVVRTELEWEDLRSERVSSDGPGNALLLGVEGAHLTEIFTGFGRRGVPAEEVARGATEEVRRYLETTVPVGTHLADQLLLPMALAGGGSFRTLPPTAHFRTNAHVLERLLETRVSLEGGAAVTVQVSAP